MMNLEVGGEEQRRATPKVLPDKYEITNDEQADVHDCGIGR